MQVAVQEAVDEYKAVNSLTYGKLTYLLLVAMAGDLMTVYAMPLAEKLTVEKLVNLVPAFEVRSCTAVRKF